MLNYDRTDERVIDALDVIAKCDPALYRRMMRDDWTVTYRTCDLPTGVQEYVARGVTDHAFEIYGATQPKACDGVPDADTPGRTTLFADNLARGASRLHVPIAYFTASTLAHEYEHITQPCEQDTLDAELPAYDAGAQFARKLPYPYGERIAQVQEEEIANQALMRLLGF